MSRLNLFPRLRQACHGDHRPATAPSAGGRVGQGSGAAADALDGHPSFLTGAAGARRGRDVRLELNRVYLSGVLVADPQYNEGRDGSLMTLLLVAFAVPDTTASAATPEAASCEVEVPAGISGCRPKELRVGGSIFITGRLSNGGGVIATKVHSGPPLEQVIDVVDQPHASED